MARRVTSTAASVSASQPSPSSLPRLALPGTLLAASSTALPGAGTHIHDKYICASIAGPVTVRPRESDSNAKDKPKQQPRKEVISIVRGAEWVAGGVGRGTAGLDGKIPILPQVGSECICRVIRVGMKQAWVGILVVDGFVIGGANGAGGGYSEGGGGGDAGGRDMFQGIIRQQDVRATEKDSVVVAAGSGREGGSFRVGDLVRGVVISLGDQTAYYLSTASNHLGVIMATSEAGNAMYPISWKEFRDPVTGLVESRKVAKPF